MQLARISFRGVPIEAGAILRASVGQSGHEAHWTLSQRGTSPVTEIRESNAAHTLGVRLLHAMFCSDFCGPVTLGDGINTRVAIHSEHLTPTAWCQTPPLTWAAAGVTACHQALLVLTTAPLLRARMRLLLV